MKRIFVIVVLALVAGGVWYLEQTKTLSLIRLDVANAPDLATIDKTVSTPPPLKAERDAPNASLSVAGTFQETNRHRSAQGLAALRLNAKLNAAAEAKLADMFARQYFAHESPDGRGPGDLADAAGYAYITVGENLALGNFENDAALVQAWMDSPGHRANILSGSYAEIGIAVGRGTYEGKTTWMAVQEFGKPLSACPQPDAALQTEIVNDEERLEMLKTQADALRTELESERKPKRREDADAYNEKVERYNALVREINALIAEIQGEVTVYNGQVEAFNRCAGS
ncbi:MAG: CAP domain-containing protein [Patescibacteria group bacterium]|nr:MAG: CAP domain-containing protein [Patescibacteria group bacterium]